MSASFCLPSTHVAPQVPLWKALIILAWAREKERCDFFCVSSRKKKKKEKKISKNKYFCEHGAATRKIWAHRGRNKDDGFASWHVRMLCVPCVESVCVWALQSFRPLQLLHCLFGSCACCFLNCACRTVSSVCNCASLSVWCVCKRSGMGACCRERPKNLQAVWGSREPLEIAGRGTDKAASHSSGQMKAVKLTGGAQASPQDGSRRLSGDLWLTHVSRRACMYIHTQLAEEWGKGGRMNGLGGGVGFGSRGIEV